MHGGPNGVEDEERGGFFFFFFYLARYKWLPSLAKTKRPVSVSNYKEDTNRSVRARIWQPPVNLPNRIQNH